MAEPSRALKRTGGAAPVDRDSEPPDEALPAPEPEVLVLLEQGRALATVRSVPKLVCTEPIHTGNSAGKWPPVH